jgi:hypothetical protein
MDRSYAIAAAVQFVPGGKGSVTFHVKDLANDDELLRTTTVPHSIQGPPRPAFPLVIGDLTGTARSLWDGLIDEVRLRRGAAPADGLSYNAPALTPDTVACWQFEPAPGRRTDTVTGRETIQSTHTSTASARETALSDLCHSLMGSSAMLYVE